MAVMWLEYVERNAAVFKDEMVQHDIANVNVIVLNIICQSIFHAFSFFTSSHILDRPTYCIMSVHIRNKGAIEYIS